MVTVGVRRLRENRRLGGRGRPGPGRRRGPGRGRRRRCGPSCLLRRRTTQRRFVRSKGRVHKGPPSKSIPKKN